MIKLVCIDVDGTLVGTGGAIADRVWPAAEAARAAGVHLALCSGRPAFGNTRGYAERLDPGGWHVFQNGASILRLSTGESRSTPLSPEVVAELKARARRIDRPLELYSDHDYAVESTGDRARRHAELLGLTFRPRSLDSLEGAVVRAQWLVSIDELEAVAGEPHPGFEVNPSTSPVMPETGFVNLTARGVDKASAVRTVALALGCSLGEVMFVGDGANDLEAMRIVGMPVAMGNAHPAVLAAARQRVGHVDQGGLADALARATGDRAG